MFVKKTLKSPILIVLRSRKHDLNPICFRGGTMYRHHNNWPQNTGKKSKKQSQMDDGFTILPTVVANFLKEKGYSILALSYACCLCRVNPICFEGGTMYPHHSNGPHNTEKRKKNKKSNYKLMTDLPLC